MKQKWNAYYETTVIPATILTCISCLLLLISAPFISGSLPMNSLWDILVVFLVFLVPMTTEDVIVFFNNKFKIPRSKGGRDTMDNLVIVSREISFRKGDESTWPKNKNL